MESCRGTSARPERGQLPAVAPAHGAVHVKDNVPAQETLRRLAASLAATEASLAEEQANTRRLDDMLAAAERAAAAAQDIQIPATWQH